MKAINNGYFEHTKANKQYKFVLSLSKRSDLRSGYKFVALKNVFIYFK